MLYLIYKEAPDLANTLGLYPKADLSHGFSMPYNYEMYRDWQENSMNSDGWFAMLVYFVCFVYSLHVVWTYLLPHYWIKYDTRNEALQRFRMKGQYIFFLVECFLFFEKWWNYFDVERLFLINLSFLKYFNISKKYTFSNNIKFFNLRFPFKCHYGRTHWKPIQRTCLYSSHFSSYKKEIPIGLC